jgi:NAD(P)-dependent dehydrogenase (short-subunit alcohol dehydrogenase family)
MLLQDRTAVIYGGGGAIGGAVARVFAREGAMVVIAGRSPSRLEGVAQEIRAAGGCVETAQLDVLDERAVDAHATAVARRFGGIDVAMNAVSFMHEQGPLLPQLSLDEFMRPIDSFLRSLFITTRAVAPHMGRTREGVILTLSTPAAKMAVPGHLGYSSTCAATEAFSRSLAAELGPGNVRVVCIRPHAIADAPAAGSYTGELFEPKASALGLSVEEWLGGAAQGTMLGRLPTLADVAETAAFLASGRARAITGSVANLTCGSLVD